jgi:uncharacterized membrane protein
MSSLPSARLVSTGATVYDYLMFGHVLAAMLLLGGWAVLGLLAADTLRQGDPGTLARFTATLRFIGPRLLGPATILVAGLGAWLVLDSHQWHFSQRWIELAIGLLAAVLVVGAGFQSRAAIGAELITPTGYRPLLATLAIIFTLTAAYLLTRPKRHASRQPRAFAAEPSNASSSTG